MISFMWKCSTQHREYRHNNIVMYGSHRSIAQSVLNQFNQHVSVWIYIWTHALISMAMLSGTHYHDQRSNGMWRVVAATWQTNAMICDEFATFLSFYTPLPPQSTLFPRFIGCSYRLWHVFDAVWWHHHP